MSPLVTSLKSPSSRLTPSTKRQKNKAFAIIGEVDSSRANSRSPSPTGRVSPFRGRGFNPSGSRFASPNPTPPPPEDARLTPTNLSPRHASKIPKLKRNDSSAFGEKVHHDPTKRKLENKLSQSLTNLEQRTASRPPPSPRKRATGKTPAFQKLSPIAGSSPEPSQSLSSPSRIPKSRSTPPSRRSSPTRSSSSAQKPPPGRSSSRTASRAQSRNTSREPSPTKDPVSPTRIPVKYRNVQAKVNSFNKPKPKVPPKPQVLTDQSEESDVVKDVKPKPNLTRKESVNKLKTSSKPAAIKKTDSSNNVNSNITSDSSESVTNKTSNKNTTKNNNNNANKSTSNNNSNNANKTASNNNNNNAIKSSNNSTSTPVKEKEEARNVPSPKKEVKSSPKKQLNGNQETNSSTRTNKNRSSPVKSKAVDYTSDTDTSYDVKETSDSGRKTQSPVKLADILPSTTTVVNSTTTTVTQPLKIDASLKSSKPIDRSKQVSPMVDGRVLSATSVSNAMNRMNDSVLNTQTVIKDHGFPRMSSAAATPVSTSSESVQRNTTTDVRTGTPALPANGPNLGSSVNHSRANQEYNRLTSSDSNSRTANATPKKDSSAVVNPALDTKHATTALPRVEPVSYKPENNSVSELKNSERSNHHTNHISHGGIISAKALEMEVQRNMGKLISPEHVPTVNDRIKDARTMVAGDVKPIRIMVQGKPSDVEVQSGNVRPPVSVSNGLNERPR